MKINFDLLKDQAPQTLSPHKNNFIKVQIESPIYQKIYRSVSPHNYHHELESMRDLISVPQSVNEFIAQQISKQIQAQTNQNSIDEQSFQEAPIEVKNAMKTSQKTNKQKSSKMSWVYKYKKHRCNNNEVTSGIKQQAKEMTQLTLRPKLIPSKATKKVIEGRKINTMMGKKYSVYDCLYKDATKRQFKKMAKKQESYREQSRKPHINKNYFSKHEKVYTPIFNRLDQILEKKERVKQNSQNFDLTTGRQMFHPNLNSSKDSYKLYFQSLSKEKLVSKRNQRQNKKQIQNIPKNKKINSQKQASDSINNKTIEFFINLFYPDIENGSQIINGLDSVKQKQFIILQPFLQLIEQIQSKRYEQETTISSVKGCGKTEGALPKDIFCEHFRKYFQGLTLHDKQILREEVMKRKRQRIKVYQQSSLQMTFKPTINVRSCSLDSLAKGHQHQIYFV